MQGFWQWFLDWWPSIAGACTGVFTALAAYVAYRIKTRSQKAKTELLVRELDNAKYRLTYTYCPHCGKPVLFSDCHWKLPGDLADENLNGIPDNHED